jgi:hypothetical protein
MIWKYVWVGVCFLNALLSSKEHYDIAEFWVMLAIIIMVFKKEE